MHIYYNILWIFTLNFIVQRSKNSLVRPTFVTLFDNIVSVEIVLRSLKAESAEIKYLSLLFAYLLLPTQSEQRTVLKNCRLNNTIIFSLISGQHPLFIVILLITIMEENSEARSAYGNSSPSINKQMGSAAVFVLNSFVLFNFFFFSLWMAMKMTKETIKMMYTKCKYAFLWNAIYCLFPSTITKINYKGCSTALTKGGIDAWSRAEMFINSVQVLTNGKAANWAPEVAWIPFKKRCAVFA